MHGNIICASSLTAKTREKGVWGGYRKGKKNYAQLSSVGDGGRATPMA